MVTVHFEAGYRFVIYLNDHEPMHVHVYGDGEARINLVNLEVLSSYRMKIRDLHHIVAIVEAEQQKMIERWRQIHG